MPGGGAPLRALGLLLGLLLILAGPILTGANQAMEAGRPRFRIFGVKDGLPQGTIMSLTFDPRGVLWVGTQDGAAWYDGRTWTTLNMPDAGLSNYVESLLPTRDGSLWFGRQDGGIGRWQEGVWTRFTRAEGLPSERVTALAETLDGQGRPTLWAGTLGGGLARFDGRWHRVNLGPQLPSSRIWRLIPRAIAGGAELWVCGEGGLLRLDAQGRVLQTYPGVPNASVNSLVERTNAQGRSELWISTFGRGLGRWDDQRWTWFGTVQGLPSPFTTDVAETRALDGSSVLWAATVAGLARFKDGQWRTFTTRSGLPTDTIYRLKQDPYRPDTLWIGTAGGGLARLEDGGWLMHDAPSGLSSSFILALAQGRGGSILAGTSLGLNRWTGGRWQPIPLPTQLPSSRVNTVLESPRSGLWVGTLGGLWNLHQGRSRLYNRQNGLPHNAIGTLLEDREDDGTPVLWVGTQGGGLARLRKDHWDTFTVQQGLPGDTILALTASQEPQGRALWVGFRGGGLGRYLAGHWTFWGLEDGLPNRIVSDLHISHRDGSPRTLFASTYGGGLAWAHLDEEPLRWRVLDARTTPALPENTLHQIQEDAAGRLYLASNRGVLRLTLQAGSPALLERFTEEDGLPSIQCSPSASLVDDLGRIWIGTTQGLAELDTSHPSPAETPRPLLLRRAMAGGRALSLQPDQMTLLRPGERGLSLDVALLGFRRESEHRFRTQLEGLEGTPTPWSPDTRREFTNLPPGNYRFLVWGRTWSGHETGPLAFPFRIPPRLWETTPARVVASVVLAAALILGVRWRLALAHRRARHLEELVHQRTAALEGANAQLRGEISVRLTAERVKDEFVSIVSHELRTPLTSIRGSLGMLERGVLGDLPAQAMDIVRIAHQNTLRLIALVNDLLDLRKLEVGGITLNLSPLSLQDLILQTVEANQGLVGTFGVTFQVENAADPLQVFGDPDRLQQVLTNLLSNAAKFSPSDLPVVVRSGPGAHPGLARVSVSNQGPPIPVAFHAHIFSKFAQADATSSRKAGGTGLGLAISRTLVELHGGTIDYRSDSSGTTFWFDLPLAHP